MYIEIDKVKIDVSYSECVELYRSLKSALRYTIATHWRSHKDCFPQREAERLKLMEQLARVTNSQFNDDLEELKAFVNNDLPL